MSKFIAQIALLFVTFVICTDAAKILFLTCSPAKSHQKPFQAIWKELSIRGHEVHVLTPNPLNDTGLTNLTEYDLSSFYQLLNQQSKDNMRYLLHKPTFFSAFVKDIFATKLFSNLYNYTLSHPETRRLLESNKHFDVVIAEWIFPTLASIAAYYKAPLIGITSLGAPLVALDTLGNPSHPIASPEMNLPLKRNLSFKERLLSLLYSVYVRVYYHLVVLPREDANIKKHFDGLPYIGDIERNISVLLMNRNPVFHRPMVLFPNIVELGGIKEAKIKNPLESELEEFVSKGDKDVIYFSLGSAMQSVLLPENTLHYIKTAFSSLPYKFVWKWENDTMHGKPDNVFISKWISQIALLEHPKVKLFITQGGLQSTEEAISAHKPIIGIPFHSDQTTNVDTCVMYGMGKMLDLEDISEDILRNYISDIMNDYRYTENAKALDELMKDQPQDGLVKAVWWIEYVIRHKGAKHLRNVGVDLPWWLYSMFDVKLFIFSLVFICIFIIYSIVKFVFKLVLQKKSNKIKKE